MPSLSWPKVYFCSLILPSQVSLEPCNCSLRQINWGNRANCLFMELLWHVLCVSAQEEYFRQAESYSLINSDSSTPLSTPTPRRRNTMPSSVYFRSSLRTADSHLSVNDIKPDLYNTTDWDAFGPERDSNASELLGELIYKMEPDRMHKDVRWRDQLLNG